MINSKNIISKESMPILKNKFMVINSEQQLFDKWKKIRQGFSPDGIIDKERYLKSFPKIMLILKEVNSKKGTSFDLKDFLKNGANKRKATWDNVTRWIYGINNIGKEIKWEELEKRQFLNDLRKTLLPTICVINLKKSPGGHTTNNTEMKRIAKEDSNLLEQQFKLYYENEETQPDLIICGGSTTSSVFNKIVDIQDTKDWKRTSRGIKYYEYATGKFFINYSHPEARIQDSLLYYGLIDAIKELKHLS